VSNIDFAFSLYRQLALDTPGENFLFSPASINLALAKLSLGAPITSRAQLLESLGFNLTLVSEAEIQDSFWDLLLRLPVQVPQFLLTTGQHRFSGLGATQDLGEAQKHIAAYIEKQTWGRLGTWGQDLRNETTVVLVNHMLLKGKRVHIQHERLWNPGSICTPALLPTMNKKPALQIRRPLVSVH
jgi:serpin peptidase inhibitor clade A protein 3